MQSPPKLDLESIIDASRVGRFQIVIMVLCALIAMLDGFDTQAIAFVAPAILQEWHLASSVFGPVFGAGLLGGLLGAIIFGAISDRIGRKPALLFAVLLFSAGSLVTPLSTSVPMLAAVRLVTGLGLGGALPSFISLTSEYAPKRLRATLVATMFCGFPLGAVIGGLASTRLIPAFGWSSVFVVGGILPILIMPLFLALAPESVRYLALRNNYARIGRVLRRMGVVEQWNGEMSRSTHCARAPMRSLFQDGRAPGTILLWTTLFLSLLLTYFLINWIPLVAQRNGLDIRSAVHAVAMLNLGSIAGCVVLGRLADRFGTSRIVGLAFALGALAIALIGFAGQSGTLLSTITFVSGFLSIGAQMCTIALCAGFYDTSSRATGIGWSMGVGRLGAIVGPVLGGILLGAGMDARQLFIAVGTTSLGAAIAVFAIGHVPMRQTRTPGNQVTAHDSPVLPRRIG